MPTRTKKGRKNANHSHYKGGGGDEDLSRFSRLGAKLPKQATKQPSTITYNLKLLCYSIVSGCGCDIVAYRGGIPYGQGAVV
jgi:hypothetical protein